MAAFPDPIKKVQAIVDPDRTPTGFFVQQWALLLRFVKDTLADITALILRVARLEAVSIATTSPITGGGNILNLSPIAHANSGVTPGAYTNANITVDAKGHLTAAANGIAGSTAWTLLSSRNFAAAPGANYDVNGLAAYTDVLVLLINGGTTGGASFKIVRASVDNGATFFSTNGDYYGFTAAGNTTATANSGMGVGTDGGSAGPFSGFVLVNGIDINGAPKTYQNQINGGAFVGSNAPVTAVRLTTTGGQTINAGNAYVFVR